MTPTALKLRRGSRLLEVQWADSVLHALPWEYLRVFSPSAEVQGHGAGESQLVGGKRNVAITAVEPVGQYAVRLRFDDGHDTGLYSWDVLRLLGEQQAANWLQYEQRLAAARMSRDSDIVTLAGLSPPRHHRA